MKLILQGLKAVLRAVERVFQRCLRELTPLKPITWRQTQSEAGLVQIYQAGPGFD